MREIRLLLTLVASRPFASRSSEEAEAPFSDNDPIRNTIFVRQVKPNAVLMVECQPTFVRSAAADLHDLSTHNMLAWRSEYHQEVHHTNR